MEVCIEVDCFAGGFSHRAGFVDWRREHCCRCSQCREGINFIGQ